MCMVEFNGLSIQPPHSLCIIMYLFCLELRKGQRGLITYLFPSHLTVDLEYKIGLDF